MADLSEYWRTPTLSFNVVGNAMQVNTQAVLGNNTEAYSYADMINTD